MKIQQHKALLCTLISMMVLLLALLGSFHDHESDHPGSAQEDCSVCLILEEAGTSALPEQAAWVTLLALVVHLVLFKAIALPTESCCASYHTRAPPYFFI